MQKSVYSIVLMDDVVSAVDRLAYAAGTSRSNMINRILADAVSMATPEQHIQAVFAAVNDFISRQSILQPMLSPSDAMLNLRSALQYKYNPSVRYVVELYPHAGAQFGELRAGLRTQNPTLLLAINQFYKLWAKLEAACLAGSARECAIGDGRYTRRLQTPEQDSNLSAHDLGCAIANYTALFDACLKAYFDHLDMPEEAIAAVQRTYRSNLDSVTVQL